MTATAEIRVTEIDNALLVPNAALRYSPPVAATEQRSFLSRLLPGPPSFRAASPREEAGPNRTLWVLRDGRLVALKVVVGPSDGKRTLIDKGELAEGQALILDQTSVGQ
jgi:HlyD family secretion protein